MFPKNTFKAIKMLAGKVTVSSALNSPLWLCVVISLPCLGALIFVQPLFLRVIFLIFAAAPVVLVIFAYIYFMISDPTQLRSEDYLIRKQSLELLGDKDNKLPATGSDIVAITDPKGSTKEIPQDHE